MKTSSAADKAQSTLANLPTWLQVSDIQGLAQLATHATLGMTGLAENVQGNVYKAVAKFFGPLGARFVDAAPGSSGVKPAGITGLVYGGVKGVTQLAGGTVNAVLSGVAPRARPQPSSRRREAMLSALNGVLGDHLQATANPLAITMRLRHEGEPLILEKTTLALRLPKAKGKVLVLIHGLCMNDLQWRSHSHAGVQHPAHDHGLQLAAELGYTPVYLHYNTGLHISANGQQLADLLEQLLQTWPQPVQELTLLTHSMGGLVARSACHHGEVTGHAWRQSLKHLVFLGTPHGGAPLEGLGHWVDQRLGSNPVTRPFAAIGQIRSAGIRDLRAGKVLSDADSASAPAGLPLPSGVACFAVAATTAAEPADGQPSFKTLLTNRYVGDGLVPVQSALGLHKEPGRCLTFALENQWIAHGVNHMELLSRPEVGRQLVAWLRPSLTP